MNGPLILPLGPETDALNGPALVADALHRALHELESIHGLQACDGAAVGEPFAIDTVALCAHLTRAISQLSDIRSDL